MKKVLTVGVYDFFHLGHLRLFLNAKNLGDYLIVAVQDGEYILKYKPNAEILYSTEQRIEIVSSIKPVDKVIIYKDVEAIVKEVDFDVFAVGGDQNHKGFQKAMKWCEEYEKKVVVLPRTEGICSSQIKLKLSNG